MKTVSFRLTGVTPLLLHADNIDWADQLEAWRRDGQNKKRSKAGDDRSPAWTWIGYLWHDGNRVGIIAEALLRCMSAAGASYTMPGSRKSYKAAMMSAVRVPEFVSPIETPSGEVRMADVEPLKDEDSFETHRDRVRQLGFELDVRRVKIGQSKHIRVRPRFDRWHCDIDLLVDTDVIDIKTLTAILNHAGQYQGVGDFIPGAKTPGLYGQFKAELVSQG